MSECSMTAESLRRHLPFLNKLIAQMKGNPFVKELQSMKNVIECDYGKKLSCKQVHTIEIRIAKIKEKACRSTSGSSKKNMNNKIEVIYISSDDETSNTNLSYHKEHEVVEINSLPKRPDVEIIMTKIPTNNITSDTDSQKLKIKSERCEVETIIKEVKLTSDHNSNSQQENYNLTDLSSIRVKEEESESDIDDFKTVYSGYSDQYDPSEPVAVQNDDNEDEIIKPTNINRKRRKISSSSDESNKSKNKENGKRQRFSQNSELSDDENKSQKTTSSTSRKRRRNKSNSLSESEFFSAESEFFSAGSPDTAVMYKTSIEDDTRTLENFRATILTLSTNKETTDTNEIVMMIKESMQDESERVKILSFLQQCCDRGILELDVNAISRNSEIILNEFVKLTLSSTRQLRNRVVAINEKNNTSSDEEHSESSEHSILDFSDDQDYQCYLNKKSNPAKNHKVSKKLRCRKRTGELEKLKEDIDRSFMKSGLLTLKPREHKNVNYNIDNVSSSSDDSDAFVNIITKTKTGSTIKKKRGIRHIRGKRHNDSNSVKTDQSKNIESDESDSEIGMKRPQRVKWLEDLDSDRTTPDNLIATSFELSENEDNENSRSTPDIDLDNDPRVISFENKNNSRSDEEIDTDCSSGESIPASPKHISLSNEDEDENNPKYHFITVQNTTGCQVQINKLNLVYKTEPYKVYLQNGVWKVGNADLSKDSADDNEPHLIDVNIQNTSKDHPLSDGLVVFESTNNEDPTPNVSNIKTQIDENKDIEDQQNYPITPDFSSENCDNSIEDHLCYDFFMSESDEDFINMEPNKNMKDLLEETKDEIREDEKLIKHSRQTTNSFTETKYQNDKPDKNLSYNVAENPLDSMTDSTKSLNSITEEKYKIQEPSLYDLISSDSEDDALHIDMEAETNKNELKVNKNKENMTKFRVQANNQNSVANNNIGENKNIQKKTTESNSEEQKALSTKESGKMVDNNKVSPAKRPNPSLKEKLNKNSILSERSSSPQTNKTIQQKTSQKTTVQNVSSNNSRRKCSPMSKLLTENEKKIFNLSYTSCRGGYQYRCLISCEYYNLREDAFKYHIQSRHVMDKWSGFCNLCGKSFSNENCPLIDEYEHMMKYHIMPEHDQKISIKENIDQVNENDFESHDSDCIILSQPSENNSEVENRNSIADLTNLTPQSEVQSNEQNKTTEAPISSNAKNVSNEQLVRIENPIPKQILRVKCLPGDKLSGRNEEGLMSPVDPEMKSGEMARNRIKVENQLAVQETSFIPPMTLLPEGYIPETTAEQEATLEAVKGENISRYFKADTQTQQSRAKPYPVRPTASNAPSPQRSCNKVKSKIQKSVITSTNNVQIVNSYINTVVLAPATNTMPNFVLSVQNQNLSTCHENVSRNLPSMLTEDCKLRSFRPWLNIDDIKAKDLISKCFEKQYLSQLYKCMLMTCSFATDNPKDFLNHLKFHRKSGRNPIFCCSYCTYNTTNSDDLVSHISTKYSRCRYYCSRCFYRTCSQYNAVEHTKIHKNIETIKVHYIQTILPIMEDQEFDKIILRKLPALKCFDCPQIFHMYEQFRIHVQQCCTSSSVLCYKCKKVSSITNLEDHQTNCYGVYTYNCCYCPFGTQMKNNMSDHVIHAHMDKIPFYIERLDTSHLSSPLLIKAACVKKFAANDHTINYNYDDIQP